MASLKLHHRRKKSDERIRHLKAKLERSENVARQIEAEILDHAQKHNQPFEDLVAKDKCDLVAEMSKIEPTIDAAWKAYDKSESGRYCTSTTCRQQRRFYRCVFDMNDTYRFCHKCFNDRNFRPMDVEFLNNWTKHMKEDYLEWKSIKSYMDGDQPAEST